MNKQKEWQCSDCASVNPRFALSCLDCGKYRRPVVNIDLPPDLPAA